MPARKRVGLSIIVGENVKRLRLRAGMSQTALAEAAGVRQASISSIESGDRGASMMMLMAIAKALGVSSTSLFKEPKR
jgi:transcriptional regulator with XRE-family HTH domain